MLNKISYIYWCFRRDIDFQSDVQEFADTVKRREARVSTPRGKRELCEWTRANMRSDGCWLVPTCRLGPVCDNIRSGENISCAPIVIGYRGQIDSKFSESQVD